MLRKQCFVTVFKGFKELNDKETYASESLAAVVMEVLHHVEEPGGKTEKFHKNSIFY